MHKLFNYHSLVSIQDEVLVRRGMVYRAPTNENGKLLLDGYLLHRPFLPQSKITHVRMPNVVNL